MSVGTIASPPHATLRGSYADGGTCGDVQDSARIKITVDRLENIEFSREKIMTMEEVGQDPQLGVREKQWPRED